jgi:cell wall-associated NlpC family hydrolase
MMIPSAARPWLADGIRKRKSRGIGARAASFRSVQTSKTSGGQRNLGTIFCLAAALLFLTLTDAQARTSRHRKRTAFSVALQPFSLVHAVVHAVAAPVISNAPRVLRAAAITPIKVAYYAPRAIVARAPRAERIDDELGEGAQPIRAAYIVPRRTRDAAPEADSRDDYDQDREQDVDEESSRIETRGDHPTVSGSRAVLRNGVAYAPSQAPQRVKSAIWAANTLRRKPYVWGGGHGSFYDHGYDCSGSVSFALHGAGVLAAPLPSNDFMRYGERGRGRWITIYSRPGHTFAVIGGLRLDTTDFRRGGDVGPRWYNEGRDLRGFQARHPAGM